MHILLTGNTAFSMYNFRRGVIEEFLRRSYKVTIVAPYDQAADQLKALGCHFVHIDIDRKGTNPLAEIKLIFDLYRIYKETNPDIIFHYTIKPNIYGSIAAHFLKVNSIAITTGLGYTFTVKNFVSECAKLLYRISFRYPKQVWFLNKDDLEEFLKHKLITPQKAFLLDSEGVDLNHFQKNSFVQKKEKTVFLLISRILKDKGIYEFVEAARMLRDSYPSAEFQILGPIDLENPAGIPEEEVLKWDKEGIIKYLGVTTDVRPYIDNADSVVLPSFYREGVPRTLLEAGAMGKPLITTNNVGCKETVIDRESGFLVDPKSVSSLKNALEEFISMSQEKKEMMGQKSHQLIKERFSEEYTIKKYLEKTQEFSRRSILKN